MDLGLAGRVAIVTGASRGIGKACAAELAAEGADVVLLSKDFVRNEAACAELQPHAKGRVVGAPADLNDEAAVRAVFARTMEEFGRLDILVNCGAVIGRGDFFSLDEARWARLFEDKLDGTARCLRLAAPLMRARRGRPRRQAASGTAGRADRPHSAGTYGRRARGRRGRRLSRLGAGELRHRQRLGGGRRRRGGDLMRLMRSFRGRLSPEPGIQSPEVCRPWIPGSR